MSVTKINRDKHSNRNVNALYQEKRVRDRTNCAEKILAAHAGLRCVVAREKIGATALELRKELFGQLDLQLRLVCFAQCPEETTETEWRRIPHHRRLGRTTQLFRLSIGVFDLAR